MAFMLYLLLVATVCLMTVTTGTQLSSTADVDLRHLAGAMYALRQEEDGVNDENYQQRPQRFGLRHLEAMWQTSLGTELDSSASGREKAFLATVDAQWELLVSQNSEDKSHPPPLSVQHDGNSSDAVPGTKREESGSGATNSPLRFPFIVCGDRHPDAILALERVVHHTRTQLAYSRGDTACLLAGVRLDEVETLRVSERVHVIEPLPQPAKLSPSLHAELEDPLESSDDVAKFGKDDHPSSGSKSSGEGRTEDVHSVGGSQNNRQPSAPRSRVVFNHGEGLPSDLEISLTPGTEVFDLGDTWAAHLTSFQSTAHLWDEHLRERFLWTRQPASDRLDDEMATTGAEGGAGDENGEMKRRSLDHVEIPLSVAQIPRDAPNTLVEAHGLDGLEKLWNHAADSSSSKDETCDFWRLRTALASEKHTADSDIQGSGGKATPHNVKRNKRRRRRSGGRLGRSQRELPFSKKDGESTRDRVVLRGASSLGSRPQDNAHCLLTLLAYLVTRPEVAYVDDLPQVFELNVEAAWITQSGEETTYSMWDQGIDGRTETIAVADSGLDMKSCFFSEADSEDHIECSTYSSPVFDLTKRKVVQYIGYVDCEDMENGHGTHVAGSAVGGINKASPGDHFGDGSGFGAKLAVFDFGDEAGDLVTPTNLQTQMLQPPYDLGARISTNSWGAVRNTYTSLDRQVDNFAYVNPDMLIIVAAGNCGDEISGCEYQGAPIFGAGSILSPALAKNVVAVGASEASPSSAGLADNVDEVAYFSSQGPTADDGRIKPDVVAPGYHLFSATAKPSEGASCEIGPMAGTSMATPVVAGVAAMIRQYFVQGWYPSGMPTPEDMFNPSNALVKAMLVSSGTAMASYDGSAGATTLGSPPDGVQGFGRVLLDSVLNVRGSVDLYVQDSVEINHGEVHSYMIDMDGVSSSAFDGDMKATMVWMEPAAFASSVHPVFNDLDLLVVAFDGTSEVTFYPNNLAAKDPTNTVEMVVIPNVDSYEWFNVTVTAATVITTTELPYYALVVTGGVSGEYSPTASIGRIWFVRWEMDIVGLPIVQVATQGFESGLADAISSETGEYTNDSSTVVVKIDHLATDDIGDSSTVTVEVDVASEADGYAILTYVLSVVEGTSSSVGGSQGLTAALNEALASRTTDGCLCVAVAAVVDDGGRYDCSACEEGEAFSTAISVTTSHGGYDLLSTERSKGRSPVSVFDSADSQNDDDMFWNDIARGKVIRAVIRSDSYVSMVGVVVAIVFCTFLGSFCLRCCVGRDDDDDVTKRSNGGELLATGTQVFTDKKHQQRRTNTLGVSKRNHRPGTFTPEPTPAP